MEQGPYSNGGLESMCIAVSSGNSSRAVKFNKVNMPNLSYTDAVSGSPMDQLPAHLQGVPLPAPAPGPPPHDPLQSSSHSVHGSICSDNHVATKVWTDWLKPEDVGG